MVVTCAAEQKIHGRSNPTFFLLSFFPLRFPFFFFHAHSATSMFKHYDIVASSVTIIHLCIIMST